MFQVKAWGRFAGAHPTDEGVMLLHVPHHDHGYNEPVVVRLRASGRNLEAISTTEIGGSLWVEGSAAQERGVEDGRDVIWLAIWVDLLTVPTRTLMDGSSPMQAVAHASIYGDIEFMPEAKSHVRMKEPKDVTRFKAHVGSPHMERGLAITLWVTVVGEQARFLAEQHSDGDRINLSGDLLERRFDDADGVPRTSHELRVRSWSYGKDRGDRTVLATMTRETPIQADPVVQRRGAVAEKA